MFSVMPKPSRRREDFSAGNYLMQQWKFHYEDLEEYDYPPSDSDDDDDEKVDTYNLPNPHQAILKYLKQIRSNFGFDLNCRAPSWFNGPLVWVDLADAKANEVTLYESVMKACEVAICEINEEMEKTYEFVEVLNDVLSLNFKHRLTIAATDAGDPDAGVITIQAIVYEDVGFKFNLEEWRFKPAGTSIPAPLPYAPGTSTPASITDAVTGAVVTSTLIPDALTDAVVTPAPIPDAGTSTPASITDAVTGAVVTSTLIPDALTDAVVTPAPIPDAGTSTPASIPDTPTGAVVTSIPDALTDAVVTSTSIPDAATSTANADANC